MTAAKAPERLLLPSEVAVIFRVDLKTVIRWAQRGKLTGTRTLGGHWRFPESGIQRALAGDTAAEEIRAEDFPESSEDRADLVGKAHSFTVERLSEHAAAAWFAGSAVGAPGRLVVAERHRGRLSGFHLSRLHLSSSGRGSRPSLYGLETSARALAHHRSGEYVPWTPEGDGGELG